MHKMPLHPERALAALASLLYGVLVAVALLPYLPRGPWPTLPGTPAFLGHREAGEFYGYLTVITAAPVTAALLYLWARHKPGRWLPLCAGLLLTAFLPGPYRLLGLLFPLALGFTRRFCAKTIPPIALPDKPTPPRTYLFIPTLFLVAVACARPFWPTHMTGLMAFGYWGSGVVFAIAFALFYFWGSKKAGPTRILYQNRLMLFFLSPAPLALLNFELVHWHWALPCLTFFVLALLGLALWAHEKLPVVTTSERLHKLLGFFVIPLMAACLWIHPNVDGPLDPFHESEKWAGARLGGPLQFTHGPIKDGGLAQIFYKGETPIARMRKTEAVLSALAFGAFLALAGSLLPPYMVPFMALMGIWGFFFSYMPPRFLPGFLALALALHAKRRPYLWAVSGAFLTLCVLYALDTGAAFGLATLVVLLFGPGLRQRLLFFTAGLGGTLLLLKPVFFNHQGLFGLARQIKEVLLLGPQWFALPLMDPTTLPWPRQLEWLLLPVTLILSLFLLVTARARHRRLHARPWFALWVLCFTYGFYAVGRSDDMHLITALIPVWILLASVLTHQIKLPFGAGLMAFFILTFPVAGSFRQAHRLALESPKILDATLGGVRVPAAQARYYNRLSQELAGFSYLDLTGEGLLYAFTRTPPPEGFVLSYWASPPKHDAKLARSMTQVERVLLKTRPGPGTQANHDGLYTPLYTPRTSARVFQRFTPQQHMEGTWILTPGARQKVPPAFFKEDLAPLPLGHLPQYLPRPQKPSLWRTNTISTTKVETLVLDVAGASQAGKGVVSWNKRKGVTFVVPQGDSALVLPVAALPFWVYEREISHLQYRGPGQATFYWSTFKSE